MKKVGVYLGFFIICFLLVGCGARQSGIRTVNFGPDGMTVTSETVEMDGMFVADIEKEKTRQICYKQQRELDDKKMKAVADNPLVLAIWEQTKALNNAFSIIATGKPYDPCPSSTNSADVEIADAKMYEKIYSDGFSLLKFGTGMWAGTEIADSFLGAVLGGGYSINLNGEGSSFNATDSFKNSNIGGNSTIGGVFSNKTEEIAEEEESEIESEPESE